MPTVSPFSPAKNPTYVVGHKNPDADSICSAVAYAAFKLREKRRPNVPTTRDMPLDDGGEPIFFSRYLPSEMEMQADRNRRDF